MPKSPFEVLVSFYRERTERIRKTNEFLFTQTDGFITWIIGFAFTGLLLFVANLDKLQNRSPVHVILVCIFITIITGISCRYVSFLMISFEKSLDDYFTSVFSNEDMTPIELDPEVETADFDKILDLLKVDFGDSIVFPRPLNEEEKAIELPKLKEHYKKHLEVSKARFQIAINHLAEINLTAYKIKKEKTLALAEKSMNKPNFGYNLVLWTRIRTLVFTACLLSFLSGVSILCFSLLLIKH